MSTSTRSIFACSISSPSSLVQAFLCPLGPFLGEVGCWENWKTARKEDLVISQITRVRNSLIRGRFSRRRNRLFQSFLPCLRHNQGAGLRERNFFPSGSSHFQRCSDIFRHIKDSSLLSL